MFSKLSINAHGTRSEYSHRHDLESVVHVAVAAGERSARVLRTTVGQLRQLRDLKHVLLITWVDLHGSQRKTQLPASIHGKPYRRPSVYSHP